MGTRNSKIAPNARDAAAKYRKQDTTDSGSGSLEGASEEVPQKVAITATITATITPTAIQEPKSQKVITRTTSGPPLHMIPATKKPSPTSVTQPSDESETKKSPTGRTSTRNKFSVGDKVLGNFEDAGEWYPGIITSCDDGLYNVLYDDGDAEDNMPASSIKARPKGPSIFRQPSADLSNSPPLSAIKDVSPKSTVSKVLKVMSSSILLPDEDNDTGHDSSTPKVFGINRTHSSSFKHIPVSSKKTNDKKAAVAPPINSKPNAEIDDYGEYDGSLDFVPRTSSMKNIIQDNFDDDDEFAELEKEEENRKDLLKSGMTIERHDSAVIKNMYREDSKNVLLSPQYYEEKKATENAAEQLSNISATVPVNRSDSTNDITGTLSEGNTGNINDASDHEVENVSSNQSEHVDIQSETENKETERINTEVKTGVTKDDNIVQDHTFDEPSKQESGDADSIARSFVKHEIDLNKNNKRKKKDKEKCPAPKPVPFNETTQVSEGVAQKSKFKEVWDTTGDDDIFGMNGMDIQRVDSIESVEDGGGQDICFYDNSQGQYDDQDQDYYSSHNDSFFSPHVAEQSHADSFYSDHNQSGTDWGKISEQSALLYEHGDNEEEVKAAVDVGAPTDSGWSLCYTADGTPYFYSYELQESCWELPSSTRSPAPLLSPAVSQTQSYGYDDSFHSSHDQVHQSTGFGSSHSSSPGRPVSRGVVQNDDDDAPYDLGLGTMGMITTPLKKVSSTSRLKDEAGSEDSKQTSKGLKRPQSMAAMRKKKKKIDF